jgi:hypothetical protein
MAMEGFDKSWQLPDIRCVRKRPTFGRCKARPIRTASETLPAESIYDGTHARPGTSGSALRGVNDSLRTNVHSQSSKARCRPVRSRPHCALSVESDERKADDDLVVHIQVAGRRETKSFVESGWSGVTKHDARKQFCCAIGPHQLGGAHAHGARAKGSASRKPDPGSGRIEVPQAEPPAGHVSERSWRRRTQSDRVNHEQSGCTSRG